MKVVSILASAAALLCAVPGAFSEEHAAAVGGLRKSLTSGFDWTCEDPFEGGKEACEKRKDSTGKKCMWCIRKLNGFCAVQSDRVALEKHSPPLKCDDGSGSEYSDSNSGDKDSDSSEEFDFGEAESTTTKKVDKDKKDKSKRSSSSKGKRKYKGKRRSMCGSNMRSRDKEACRQLEKEFCDSKKERKRNKDMCRWLGFCVKDEERSDGRMRVGAGPYGIHQRCRIEATETFPQNAVAEWELIIEDIEDELNEVSDSGNLEVVEVE